MGDSAKALTYGVLPGTLGVQPRALSAYSLHVFYCVLSMDRSRSNFASVNTLQHRRGGWVPNQLSYYIVGVLLCDVFSKSI